MPNRKDERFPDSEGVYRTDVAANRKDEKISDVVFDEQKDAYLSEYEQKATAAAREKREK